MIPPAARSSPARDPLVKREDHRGGVERVDALLRHLRRKGRAASPIGVPRELPARMPGELRALIRALAIGRYADLGAWLLEARAVAPAHEAVALINEGLEPHQRVAPQRAAVIGGGVDGATLLATWGLDDDGDRDRSWSMWNDVPADEVVLVAVDDPDTGYVELGTLDDLIADALELVIDHHAEPTRDLSAIASLVR